MCHKVCLIFAVGFFGSECCGIESVRHCHVGTMILIQRYRDYRPYFFAAKRCKGMIFKHFCE